MAGPLLKSICQQISYFYMLPFEDIPDDTVPVTAFLKVTNVFFFLHKSELICKFCGLYQLIQQCLTSENIVVSITLCK
jgi:hypothetical protein